MPASECPSVFWKPKSEDVGKLAMRAASTWPSHEAIEGRAIDDEVAVRLSCVDGVSTRGGEGPVTSTGEGEECIDGVGSHTAVKAGKVVSTAAMARAVLGKAKGKRSAMVVEGSTAMIARSKDEEGSGVIKGATC